MPDVERIQELLGDGVEYRGAALKVRRRVVDVTLPSARRQRVECREDTTHVLLESIAARDADTTFGRAEIDELILRTNHAQEAVGLRRRDGALVVFLKVLKTTLDRNEAVHAILAVAREADRIEQAVTGRDVE